MSEETRSPSKGAVAAAEDSPPAAASPTITHYQQIIVQVAVHFDAIRALLPMLAQVTPENRALIRRKRNIPQQFVNTAVDSLSLSGDLQNVLPPSEAVAARDDAQLIEALRPAKLNSGTLDEQISITLALAEARQATRAQKVYGVARGLAVDPKQTDAVQHVAKMKRARTRRSKKAQEPVPATEPQGGATTQT